MTATGRLPDGQATLARWPPGALDIRIEGDGDRIVTVVCDDVPGAFAGWPVCCPSTGLDVLTAWAHSAELGRPRWRPRSSESAAQASRLAAVAGTSKGARR